MNTTTALESRDWVRHFVAQMREALITGEAPILEAAQKNGTAQTPTLTIYVFPLREGPEQAERIGKIVEETPEVAMQIFRQALDGIEAEADSELRRNSDGEIIDYHFPTDRTHPFRMTVAGEKTAFLLTWETDVNAHHYITLYTRDAR